MTTKLSKVFRVLARSFSLLSGNAFSTFTPTQGVFAIPGPTLDVTIGTENDNPIDQTDPHASSDWVSYTYDSFYGIPFQNLGFWTVFMIGLNHKRATRRID